MVIKGGLPLVYGPQFGALGNACAALCASFVSQAALAGGAARHARTNRMLLPVQGTRSVRKGDMQHNSLVPDLRVDPTTHTVTVDGLPRRCRSTAST
jgi:urease subunit alpha